MTPARSARSSLACSSIMSKSTRISRKSTLALAAPACPSSSALYSGARTRPPRHLDLLRRPALVLGEQERKPLTSSSTTPASLELVARLSETSITRPGRRCSTSTPWAPCGFQRRLLNMWHAASADLSSPLPAAWDRLPTIPLAGRLPTAARRLR